MCNDAGKVAFITLTGETFAVRDGLASLLSLPMMKELPETDRGTTEIVLAEVLNNIVEHAYADNIGKIDITICTDGPGLLIEVRDRGAAFPRGSLPPGNAPALDPCDLPEGGFGWFLIRSFATNLRYRQVEGQNILTFGIDYAENQPLPQQSAAS